MTEVEYLSEIAELKAKLQDTEAVRDAFRNDWFALRQEAEDLRAEVEELKAERIEARERESVSLDAGSNAIIGLTAERDQLRAEVERLEEVCGLTLGGTYETGNYQRLHETAVAAHKRHTLRMQRKNAVAMGLPDDHPIFQDPYPGPEAPSQEPEAGSAGADNAIAWQNALQGIRWALADLGLRVHEMRSVEATAEATMSAVEVLCVHLRKEGRVWTGEMLGGLTCPSQMQKEDNAALKQRVFTALGERLEYDLRRGDPVDPNLIAQYLWGSPQQDDA